MSKGFRNNRGGYLFSPDTSDSSSSEVDDSIKDSHSTSDSESEVTIESLDTITKPSRIQSVLEKRKVSGEDVINSIKKMRVDDYELESSEKDEGKKEVSSETLGNTADTDKSDHKESHTAGDSEKNSDSKQRGRISARMLRKICIQTERGYLYGANTSSDEDETKTSSTKGHNVRPNSYKKFFGSDKVINGNNINGRGK